MPDIAKLSARLGNLLAGRIPDAGRRPLTGNGLLYAVLIWLGWGLTAPLRGMWQDDASMLAMALRRQGRGLAAALAPTNSPVRRLYDLPDILALATPHPVLALQLMYGAIWLGEGLAAGWIVGTLLPQRPLTRLMAVALTLTATSDYLTNNLTALGYNFAVLTLLLAAGCGLRFVDQGGAGWLLAAAFALGVSLWTIEVALPALPFLALLALLALLAARHTGGSRPRFRLVALLLAWGAVAAPAALAEWRFQHDPRGYAAAARLPLPPREIASRAAGLWYENFAPWRWAFARPVWYPRPSIAISAGIGALAAAVAVAAFALRVRRMPPEPAPAPATRVLGLAVLFALMALAANAAYANLQFSDIHYRTHVLSRVWASLALAVGAGWAAARWPPARLGILAVPALFVGLGTWGGLERQDFFLATWRQHQRELSSIVTSAPALRPGTGVILRSLTPFHGYRATEADYLMESWLELLYHEPKIQCLRLAAERGTGCRPAAKGLDCWHEGKAACVAARTCAPDHYDFDRLILMDYDPGAGLYRLRTSLAGDPLAAGAEAAASAYRPEERILRRPLSTAQRRLLLLD